jgi:hypothetical protein
MKKILSCLFCLTFGLLAAGAQETTTTVQVAPSDQVKYPDASQILNKTEPKVSALPSAKPLVAATPIPAKPVTIPAKTVAIQSTVSAVEPAVAKPSHGWFLRWVVSAADEQAAQAWAQELGWDVEILPAGERLWEVLSGPLESLELKRPLYPLAGEATLVKR